MHAITAVVYPLRKVIALALRSTHIHILREQSRQQTFTKPRVLVPLDKQPRDMLLGRIDDCKGELLKVCVQRAVREHVWNHVVVNS